MFVCNYDTNQNRGNIEPNGKSLYSKRMKQFILLTLTIFLVACAGSDPVPTIPLTTYSSSEHRFNIGHPAEWIAVESPQENYFSLGITSDLDAVTLQDASLPIGFVYGEVWDRADYIDSDDPAVIQTAWLSNYGLVLEPIEEMVILERDAGDQVQQTFAGSDPNTGDSFTVKATTVIHGDQLCVFVGIMTPSGVEEFTPVIEAMFRSIELGG
jgi:hypothetical protein